MLCCGVVCPAVLPDAANYRDVCVALRQEHDREVAISQQLVVSRLDRINSLDSCGQLKTIGTSKHPLL